MSDHYTVLARRFRPQTFADVVGQEHVGRAIQNAIQAGRVAHAYLFTGARGVGKTSTARIFAKALNCPNVADGVPCNACEVCDSIGDGSDVDVLEIDGASNRGIDDIRQLRANVNIRSMRSPFKVYIIDEVHMLTKEAFNALLKTLEEPPPNVKFIFCTTEPQKVPDTILSRCQRFDFGTITSDRIGDRLREIAAAEGIGVDDEAIAMVARRAAGSMRDSQSLFDQLLAFGGEQVTAADVHRLFGTAPDERVIQMMSHVLDGQRAAALGSVDAALNEGVRLESLTDQIVAYLRDLLVLTAGASTVPLSSVAERFREQLQKQASIWGVRTASAALQIIADTKQKMGRTVHGRPLLELAVIRLSMLEDLDALADLVQSARAGALAGLPEQPLKKKRLSGSPLAEARAGDPDERPSTPIAVEQAVPEPQAAVSDDTQASAEEQAAPRSEQSPASVERAPSVAQAERVRQQPAVAAASSVAAKAVESGGTQPAQTESHRPPQIELSPATFDGFWDRLIKITPERLSVALSDAKNATLTEAGSVAVTVKTDFALQFLTSPHTQKRLQSLTSGMTGRQVPFEVSVEASAGMKKPTLVRDRQQEPALRKKSLVDDDDFVQAALELFGGQLIQVKSVPLALATPVDADPDGLDDGDLQLDEEDDA